MERYEAELRKLRPPCMDDSYGQRLPHERVTYFRQQPLAATCIGDFGLHEQVAYLGQPLAGPQRLRAAAAAKSCGVPLADYASYVHGRRLRTAVPRADYDDSRCTSKRQVSGGHDVPQRFGQRSKRQVSSNNRRQLRAWATASGSSSRRVKVLVSWHKKRKHEVERKTSKPDELRKLSARSGGSPAGASQGRAAKAR